MIQYLDFEKRTPDRQYRDLLERIRRKGTRVFPQQEEEALMVFGHQMRFDLKNGFPLITERDLVSASPGKNSIFSQALGELCAFLNGARTQEELKRFGCSWWSRWVTEEKCRKRGLPSGNLGPGSYGPAWRNFPTAEGSPFDQIGHILEQIRELPHLRTHFVSPWIPQYTGRGEGKRQQVVVAPCHGWLHILVHPVKRELSLHHFQRSADVPVGLACNLIQYGALTLMLSQVTGYETQELVYTLSDAHIYENQLTAVDELLSTKPQPLPTVTVNPEVKNLFAFRPEHFKVSDYKPQLGRRMIWTPV